MNNSIINNYLKNQKNLYATALAASLVYCIAMTSMGITKFYSVLQGGDNYNYFLAAVSVSSDFYLTVPT
jgi:alpha-1,6-mannosyltransferase